jgi:GDP-L-fucose synthase
MDFQGEIKWLTKKPNGQHRKPSENQKLIGILGEYQFTSLEEGLRITVEWFKANVKAVRK